MVAGERKGWAISSRSFVSLLAAMPVVSRVGMSKLGEAKKLVESHAAKECGKASSTADHSWFSAPFGPPWWFAVTALRI